jgi:hypothetical protein
MNELTYRSELKIQSFKNSTRRIFNLKNDINNKMEIKLKMAEMVTLLFQLTWQLETTLNYKNLQK